MHTHHKNTHPLSLFNEKAWKPDMPVVLSTPSTKVLFSKFHSPLKGTRVLCGQKMVYLSFTQKECTS